MTDRARSSVARRLLFSLLTLLGACLLLEFGTRMLLSDAVTEATVGPEPIDPDTPNLMGDPYLLWRLKPGLRYEMGIVSAINTRGFRGPDWPVPKPEGTRRILAVGDSSVFGFGVEDDQVFTAILNAELEDVEVINAAVPGYSTYQVINLLEMKALAYEPDLLLIGTLWSDNNFDSFVDREMLTAYASFNGAGARQARNLLRNSALYRLLDYRFRVARKLPAIRKVGWMVGRGEQIGLRRVELNDYAANLETIVQMVHRQGGEVGFIILPNREDVAPVSEGPVAWSPYRQVMRDTAKRHGAFVIDAPALFSESNDTETLFLDEMHPTATGHSVIAQGVLAALAEREWMAGRPAERDAAGGTVATYVDAFLAGDSSEQPAPTPKGPPPEDPSAESMSQAIVGRVTSAEVTDQPIQVDLIRYGHSATNDPDKIAQSVKILASTRLKEPGDFSLEPAEASGEAYVVVYVDQTGDGPSADDRRLNFDNAPVDLAILAAEGLTIDLDSESFSTGLDETDAE